MDLGSMLSLGRSLADSFQNVVAANEEGRVDPTGYARALELGRHMETPAPMVQPGPADETAIAGAERRFGHGLPPALRRVYSEVADGGFGPGEGLLPLTMAVAQYEELRSPGMMPRGRTWPDGLLPLVSMAPGWECVDAATGRVIAWDPQELSERSREETFQRSFSERFASVEEWLSDWVTSKTQAETDAEMMAQLMSPDHQVEQAREARASIAAMSLEERRAMGLPDVGWEEVVWGGLGWEEPEEGRRDS
jgi:hypothetical protein